MHPQNHPANGFLSAAPTLSHIALELDLLFLAVYVMISYIHKNQGRGCRQLAQPPAHTGPAGMAHMGAEVGWKPDRQQPETHEPYHQQTEPRYMFEPIPQILCGENRQTYSSGIRCIALYQ